MVVWAEESLQCDRRWAGRQIKNWIHKGHDRTTRNGGNAGRGGLCIDFTSRKVLLAKDFQ